MYPLPPRPSQSYKGGEPITCLEYVLSKLQKTESDALKQSLINHNFIRNKSQIKFGDTVIFTDQYHIGFATVKESYIMVTDELSNDTTLTRTLSLFDDSLKIVTINPKLKKGSKIECQD